MARISLVNCHVSEVAAKMLTARGSGGACADKQSTDGEMIGGGASAKE